MEHRRKLTIDSINQLDLKELKYEDISPGPRTGRAYSEGRGRNKKSWYRTGVMTKIGDIRLDVWIQAAQALIEKNGDEELLKAVMEYRKNDFFHTMTNEEKLTKCLNNVVSRLIDRPEWVGFIPFNAKYRPEKLEQVEIVKILTACCNEWCDIPLAQILNSPAGRIRCPLCGIFTENFKQKEDDIR